MKGSAADKQDARVRKLVRPLWTDPDVDVRLAALEELKHKAGDVADIRAAQPALTAAFADPDPRIVRAAVTVTLERAWTGADVRLAFPALVGCLRHDDVEVRRRSWEILVVAGEHRHTPLLPPLADLVRAHAAEDADDEVRELAARVLGRVGA